MPDRPHLTARKYIEAMGISNHLYVDVAAIARTLRAMFGPARGLVALPELAREYPDLPGLSAMHEHTHSIGGGA